MACKVVVRHALSLQICVRSKYCRGKWGVVRNGIGFADLVHATERISLAIQPPLKATRQYLESRSSSEGRAAKVQ